MTNTINLRKDYSLDYSQTLVWTINSLEYRENIDCSIDRL